MTCPLALLGTASYPVSVRRPAASLPASFTPSSRSDALRFASLAVTSLREDFHLQVDAHAGRTSARTREHPSSGGPSSSHQSFLAKRMDCNQSRMFPTLATLNAPKSGTPDFGVKPGNDSGNRGTSVLHPFDRDLLLMSRFRSSQILAAPLVRASESRQRWKELQIHHTRACSDEVDAPFAVIAGLDPAIHPFAKMMDPRVKPAGDT